MARLDVYLFSAGLASSRQKAKEAVEAGEVTVNGTVCTKPSAEIDTQTVELRRTRTDYVGRGGFKLEGALNAFGVEVRQKVACDIGASTGGFTQCLLMQGARKVYAVDAGKDQLHESLRRDERVISMEETNARELTQAMLGEACDLCVMDVSFISQTLLYPAVIRILKEEGEFISLIKPQFEAGKAQVGKGGIVKDKKVHLTVLREVLSHAAGAGLYCKQVIASPITGGDGNREYLAWFARRKAPPLPEETLRQLVNQTGKGGLS